MTRHLVLTDSPVVRIPEIVGGPEHVRTNTIELQQYGVVHVVSLDEVEESWLAGFATESMIREQQRRALGDVIGFTPTQVVFDTEDRTDRYPIRPRWWDLLRRLHLRSWKTREWHYREFRACCWAATLGDYEFERRVSK